VISQRCPKCKSKRVRRGYQKTPFFLRMIGIYELLCDDCNLLFRGLAVPGTVSTRRKGGSHKRSTDSRTSSKTSGSNP
jgi:hypothetical protein